ncbi:RNA polymerase sigma factor [Dapis sp. BLCC M126]|uniref:RNA polymerase sigma factor n=1 Tax=Dapis sp. BLCC M126 TaxID=3400189 RepID=UPI003CF953FB
MDLALTERGNSDLVCQFWQQWNEHREQLYRCCFRLMNSNQTDAEDALSRAMLKAWEKVQKFEGKITNFKAWLVQVTRNLCIDIIREHSRQATGVESIERVANTEEMGMASSVESPESILEREERYIEIRRAIADLPERLHETFTLHFYEELTHTEIAERQGISYDNVCRRIYVAKKKLKEKLSNYFLGKGENVSVTAGKGRKLSTPRKNRTYTKQGVSVIASGSEAISNVEIGFLMGKSSINQEKQQSIESEEKKGLETGMKQDRATFDRHSISPSPHLSLLGGVTGGLPLQEEVIKVEKSESVNSSLELGDNLDQTIQEVATVSVEVESDRLVEAEQQEYMESAVESREQVDREIQETATELTKVESVEVVEEEKDGCVESSVESNQTRRITISKLLQLKRSGRKPSQELRRWLPFVAMTNVQLDSISKDNRYFDKIKNFIKPFLGTGSKSSQKNLFLYHPLSAKISSFLSVACCLSTASKSSQKKSFVCCLSREQTRWLRPYVMWGSLTEDNTKYGLISRLVGEI